MRVCKLFFTDTHGRKHADTIWKFADATDNPKWKGLTWGMLPLHASGIAACTYHVFYK